MRKLRKLPVFWVALVLCTFILLIMLVNESIYPSMKALTEAKVKSLAIKAMNDSILFSLSSQETYAKLVETQMNGERVYMVNTNPAALNKLSAQCASLAQEKLAGLSEQGVAISLGTLSGIAPLSGLGPDVKIRFSPAGSVKPSYSSTLENAGINQTLYKVKITLTSEVYIVLPGTSHSVTISTEAAIAESVIVGEVPQVYTNVPGGDDLLNFIPTEAP